MLITLCLFSLCFSKNKLFQSKNATVTSKEQKDTSLELKLKDICHHLKKKKKEKKMKEKE